MAVGGCSLECGCWGWLGRGGFFAIRSFVRSWCGSLLRWLWGILWVCGVASFSALSCLLPVAVDSQELSEGVWVGAFVGGSGGGLVNEGRRGSSRTSILPLVATLWLRDEAFPRACEL